MLSLGELTLRFEATCVKIQDLIGVIEAYMGRKRRGHIQHESSNIQH